MHAGPEATVTLGGVQFQWIQTNAHYPGDTLIHRPQASVTFTGDLVYVDRLLGVLPQSNVRKAQLAFECLRALSPQHGSLSETLDKFAASLQFKHLQNFDELHRADMSWVFVDFESNP